jgi:hypothetical protein
LLKKPPLAAKPLRQTYQQGVEAIVEEIKSKQRRSGRGKPSLISVQPHFGETTRTNE